MPLKPIRPAPLPPSASAEFVSQSAVVNGKNDNNNNEKANAQNYGISINPTIIRPKLDSQPRKKKPPPPRPAPPKVNKFGNVGNNLCRPQQNSLHKNHVLQENQKTVFGRNSSEKKYKHHQQVKINKNPARPPRVVHRSNKKRAPIPSKNHTRNEDALIDFDSPVNVNHVCSEGDIFDIFGNDFNSVKSVPKEKSLLDIDDLLFDNSNSNQTSNVQKSHSLPVGTNFSSLPSHPMNGIEKCEKYVTSVNSVSFQTISNEQFQKKPIPAPRKTFEHLEKTNLFHKTDKFHSTATFPSKLPENKDMPLKLQFNDQTTDCNSLHQKQSNEMFNSSSYSNFKEKEENALSTKTEKFLHVNWDNINVTSNLNYPTTEIVWDHCASPFSDVSSYNTFGSVDSNDEATDTYECPPEPEFPPPPLPPEILLEDDNISNVVPETLNEQSRALYDFEGKSPEELSFKEGDIINVQNKINSDWWQGSVNGQNGIFPASFVEVISDQRVSNSDQKVCMVTALYAFDGEEEGDLSFKVGDEIRVLSRINKDWLFGEYHGQQGQFPVSFVKQKQTHEDVHGLYVATFSFEGLNSDELSFQEGEKILVTEAINNDWWKGKLSRDSTKMGIFPRAFVQKLTA